MRETAIYYPGVIPFSEVGALRALTRVGHLRCLISMAAYGPRTAEFAEQLESQGFHVIVDSGIYTLLYGPASRSVSREKCEGMFRQWLGTCTAVLSRTSRAVCIEWDAQDIVGLGSVRRYREESQEYSARLMYVWHRSDGLAGLKDLCAPGKYVGISLVGDSGSAKFRMKTAELSATVLRQHGNRIHLLGVSSIPTLHRLRGLFDTFDSASWRSEGRFGSPESASALERWLVYSKRHGLAQEFLLCKELERLHEYVVLDRRYPNERSLQND